MEYIILRGSEHNPEDLEQEVKEYTESGWELYGPPVIVPESTIDEVPEVAGTGRLSERRVLDFQYFQALTKK
jgi:hypothetical protein